MNGPTDTATPSDDDRDLIARFVHDGTTLSDAELGRLVDVVSSVPGFADELRDQLVVHELLGQQLVEARGDFVVQVEQRIRDERSGMVGGLSSIADLLPASDATDPASADPGPPGISPHSNSLDLRAHALRDLEQWQRAAHQARTRMLLTGLAAVLLAGVGLTLWMYVSWADYGKLLPAPGLTLVRVEQVSEPTEPVTLKPGDRVKSPPGVEATIHYRDGTRITASGGTVIGIVGESAGLGKVLDLDSGDIAVSVVPQSATRPMVVRTPDARARVLGTEFELHVREGSTRLDVSRGRVELTRLADDARTTVGADQFAVASAGAAQPPLRSRTVEFPGPTWTEVDAGTVGLDPEVLDHLGGELGGSGCIVRWGRLVHSWGDPSQRGQGSRVSDAVLAHLLFLALDRDDLDDLDEAVVRREPRLAVLDPDAIDRPGKEAAITWRQLANHTSGYGSADTPGTAFHLDGRATALFADSLVHHVFLADWGTIDELVLRPHVTGPLQCEDRPSLNGEPNGLLRISPRDLARFGLLYLHEGKWRMRRLLDRRLAARATSEPIPNGVVPSASEAGGTITGQRSLDTMAVEGVADHFGSHSFGWWLNGVDRRRVRTWPSAPRDTYAALATDSGEGLVVIPSLDLVLTFTGAQSRSWTPGEPHPLDAILRQLVAATRPPGDPR